MHKLLPYVIIMPPIFNKHWNFVRMQSHIRITANYWNRQDIDGVIISTPLNWHAPIVLDALAAGKHVFCEKAMARTLDECKAIYDTYNQSDKVLYFCMQRMYDEKYIKGMQMVHSGLIGDVVGLRCHWFRNADWRRPVPSPELERKINWRLYKESSGGLMTELSMPSVGSL